MHQSVATSVLSLLASATVVFAACENHSFTPCDDGIVHWFDPINSHVCDLQDGGGGRAPPRADVPGCPLYSGTLLSVLISYLSCWTPSSAVPLTALATVEDAGAAGQVVATSAASTSDARRTTEESARETSIVESIMVSPTPSSSSTRRLVTRIKIPIASTAQLSPPRANPSTPPRIYRVPLFQQRLRRLPALVMIWGAH